MIGAPRIGSSSPQVVETTTIPAPAGGIDARVPIYDMPMELCIYTYNMMPTEYGMLLRSGYREWVTDVEEVPAVSLGVRTLMAFDGLTTGDTDDRLFAVTNEGIWDVTDFDSPPVLKLTFAIQGGDAGHGVYAHYIDQSGETFLMYADSANGLFEYTESTDDWVQYTDISGPDPLLISYVVVHKQRLWVVESDSTVGWYLPIASKNGQAEEFFFGGKFPHGGKLAALLNWTVATGSGMDDYLVAVSTAGDVIPYRGDDPSSAVTWRTVGTYFIGKLPRGRRFSGEYAGDLYLLSSFGLMAMSDLLKGIEVGDVAATSLSFKVARPLRVQLAAKSTGLTWEPKFLPSQGKLIIISPTPSNQKSQQYTMNLATESWGIWRDVPMLCVEEWHGKIYFGTVDNTIEVMDVPRDGVKLDPADPENNGLPINFSLLTAYSSAGSPGVYKMASFVRPDFFGSSIPNVSTKVLYDYNLNEQALAPGSPIPIGDFWDSGIWDQAVWGEGQAFGSHKLVGAGGVGRSMAIAIRGDSTSDLRLLSIDVMWTKGWPL